MSLKITIIDYDAGNLRNVQKTFDYFRYSTLISNKPGDIKNADILILPGVGAFHDGMNALERLGLDEAIREEVLGNGKPIMGICLGMQLMAMEGCEGGTRPGIGLLPMRIEKLASQEYGLRVPHMGWEAVVKSDGSVLFCDIPDRADFYFAHSYHAVCHEESIIAATCRYGHDIVTAVEKGNIMATQFHPEKSQRYGLQLLQNFISHCERSLKIHSQNNQVAKG